jgi:cyclase
MLPKRVIPCLDVHEGRVVKGTEFVDIRDAGDPIDLARRYEAEGADELVFLDIAATAEQRSTMVKLVRQTAAEVFIPFTVGGGVRSEADAQVLLDAGADKVAVNSAALAEPSLIGRLATRFGRQCVVLAIDAKRDRRGGWEAYAASGKAATGRGVSGWAQEAVQHGAGEVLLTSIDRDGTNSGYDLDLLRSVTDVVTVPVIASGGAGHLEHYTQAIRDAGAEAVLAASEFHSGRMSVGEVKAALIADGVAMRPALALEEQFPALDENPTVAIVDYGVGNRFSVQQALRKVGAIAPITADTDKLAEADGIVLPGVGAFQPAMEQLRTTGLDVALKRLAKAGKPILGICLGEQLLFDGSEEDGWCDGLGLLRGRVGAIETPIKPNIGWRQVRSGYFYHAHEYAARPDDQEDVIGRTFLPYSGNPDYQVPSIVCRHNVYGTQFHPEKSGQDGLRLLRNFVEISAGAQAEL